MPRVRWRSPRRRRRAGRRVRRHPRRRRWFGRRPPEARPCRDRWARGPYCSPPPPLPRRWSGKRRAVSWLEGLPAGFRFPSIVLIFAGIMRVLDSIWAFRFNGQLPDNLNGGTVGSKLTTYPVICALLDRHRYIRGDAQPILPPGGRRRGHHRWAFWLGVAAVTIRSGRWVYVGMAALVVYGLIAHFEPAWDGCSEARPCVDDDCDRVELLVQVWDDEGASTRWSDEPSTLP